MSNETLSDISKSVPLDISNDFNSNKTNSRSVGDLLPLTNEYNIDYTKFNSRPGSREIKKVFKNSLRVTNLSPFANEATIDEVFGKIGKQTSYVCRDRSAYLSLGYAYVNYEDSNDSVKALKTLNYSMILGRRCRIMWASSNPFANNENGNIFIRNLDPSIEESDLYDIFVKYGDIVSCKIPTGKNDQPKGYGYVQFVESEAAQNAIKELSGAKLKDKVIFITLHIPKEKRLNNIPNCDNSSSSQKDFTSVYVSNLSINFEKELQDLFDPYGCIRSTKLIKDKNGIPKGFAFVNYETHEQAQLAIDRLNGIKLNGKYLYLHQAQTRHSRAEDFKNLYGTNSISLYVSNLDPETTTHDLRDLFNCYGPIKHCSIKMDKEGNSRKFGFISFYHIEHGLRAIDEINGIIIQSHKIRVAVAKSRISSAKHSQNPSTAKFLPSTHNSDEVKMIYSTAQNDLFHNTFGDNSCAYSYLITGLNFLKPDTYLQSPNPYECQFSNENFYKTKMGNDPPNSKFTDNLIYQNHFPQFRFTADNQLQ